MSMSECCGITPVLRCTNKGKITFLTGGNSMSRGKLIKKTQKMSDTKGTQINAAEVSRVSKLILDQLQPFVENLAIAADALLSEVARARKRVRRK